MPNIGLILLAAGNSSRLGRAKQFLDWHGKSLLAHTLDQTNDLKLVQRLVVYGARKLEMERHLKALQVSHVYNPNWSTGMGSSIRTGLQAILDTGDELEAVLLLIVDQPLLKKHHLESILALHQAHPNRIIAASYQDTFGVPAIFPKSYFSALMTLKEQAGAKKILKKYQNQLIPFPCPEAAFDIDTEADYSHLFNL